MATVKFEGRAIPMDDAIAGNDELLKQALLPHLGPEIANATVSREQKEGQAMVVTLVKKAGPKGSKVLDALIKAPEQVNPVFGLAWMIQWNEARGTIHFLDVMDLQPAIEAALQVGEHEEKHTSRAVNRLKKADPAISHQIIVGF
ncbi:hypothetical protein KDA_75920 [Dictyobacter alpinus]|uniref:Uncharacterized protein n=1 Tax=Dictyobacter alpinus TaxID=2014873 RepID=A0A402BL66_9CHLR|nr:hypothetical protein [Dictyobacter alpinus]GCE32108.1 hypothetical protein KDA_75920 [Dictyobacter alpinus]